MNILVTGGAGFIGSNFIQYLLNSSFDGNIINIDKLTYAGNLNNLNSIKNKPNYTFVEGDICDTELLDNLFIKYNIDNVIHFAAESHVDNSISGPKAFIETNILGTFCLLESCRKFWIEKPLQNKKGFENARFHHVSTDEVYGTLGDTGLFTESTPYQPNSPYSASKASSDHLVRSYHHTYGLNIVITNCSNNYGPNQHEEKLIPTIIRKAYNGENIPIYGNGLNVRDWLFVIDHCEAIWQVFKNATNGKTYNIGGNNEQKNIDIALKICSLLDIIEPREKLYAEQITYVNDRPGHDFRYAIDASNIKNELHWFAKTDFETGLKTTINFYLSKLKQIQ